MPWKVDIHSLRIAFHYNFPFPLLCLYSQNKRSFFRELLKLFDDGRNTKIMTKYGFLCVELTEVRMLWKGEQFSKCEQFFCFFLAAIMLQEKEERKKNVSMLYLLRILCCYLQKWKWLNKICSKKIKTSQTRHSIVEFRLL